MSGEGKKGKAGAKVEENTYVLAPEYSEKFRPAAIKEILKAVS
jgi:hypothetical protein